MLPCHSGYAAPVVALAALGALTALGLGACMLLPQRLEAPKNDQATVLVLSTRMPGPIRRLARHAYLAVRGKGETTWTVWECCGPGRHDSADPFVPSFGDEVRLHGVFRGAEAERMIECLPGATKGYGDPSYWPWPGPNSNTYVDHVLRACDIPTDLPSTCIGKDHRGAVGVTWTSGGTGAQIESPIVGLRLGLTEGIELHLLGLAIGIDLWPPAIIVPIGEGRIGFADR
jgi:hypothetical protein